MNSLGCVDSLGLVDSKGLVMWVGFMIFNKGMAKKLHKMLEFSFRWNIQEKI
jgi:hypothetical protein